MKIVIVMKIVINKTIFTSSVMREFSNKVPVQIVVVIAMEGSGKIYDTKSSRSDILLHWD